MNRITKLLYLISAVVFVNALQARALTKDSVVTGPYHFKVIRDMEAGPVEDQGNSGTCWSFSGLSFFQAEALRLNRNKNVNLSEMFVVRNMYPLKAENFIRMHGKAQFGEGGEFTDDIRCLRDYGLVPQSIYDGNRHGVYDYTKMLFSLDSLLKKVVSSETTIDASDYQPKFNALVDHGMGTPPQKFDYDGKSYTPASFAASLDLKADDYVVITSFSHHPFYKPFVLEVPDNWNWQPFYNVPVDDLTAIVENALKNGYTIGWAADVSEAGFNFPLGVAVVPESPLDKMTKAEQQQLFRSPVKEKTITQAMRQAAFDNYETQDDHGMHIVGLVQDQFGRNFFRVKNSWGTANNAAGGYFYASEPYFAYKTTNIMVNKKAIPKDIAKKLGIR
jgi:bleomycin hydrolase